MKLLKQEQDEIPPMSRHSELGPQGDGTHTSTGVEITAVGSKMKGVTKGVH